MQRIAKEATFTSSFPFSTRTQATQVQNLQKEPERIDGKSRGPKTKNPHLQSSEKIHRSRTDQVQNQNKTTLPRNTNKNLSISEYLRGGGGLSNGKTMLALVLVEAGDARGPQEGKEEEAKATNASRARDGVLFRAEATSECRNRRELGGNNNARKEKNHEKRSQGRFRSNSKYL